MEPAKSAYFDPETVAVLREILEDAWTSLRPQQQATISRSLLAERILKSCVYRKPNPEHNGGEAHRE
jgi:hypothetical protein